MGWLHSASAAAGKGDVCRYGVGGGGFKQEAPDPDVKYGLHLNLRVVTTSPNIVHTWLPLNTLEGWQEDVVKDFYFMGHLKVSAQAYTANLD